MALSFNDIRVKSQKPEERFQGRILAFDPGETTGFCCMVTDKENLKIDLVGQIKTWPMEEAVKNFTDIIVKMQPDKVVFESYQVYEWKAEDHSWSQIPTVQVIGCLQTILIQMSIPYTTQTAQVAKQFCNDDKLESWGYWFKGIRHARDAVRHACYFLLFGHKKSS